MRHFSIWTAVKLSQTEITNLQHASLINQKIVGLQILSKQRYKAKQNETY
jgi:hypothetical protein